MRKISVTLLLSIAVLAACGGGSTPTSTTGTGPQATATEGTLPEGTPPTDTGGTGGGSGSAVAHVEVASGAQAGTYDSSGDKQDCNISSGGSGATYLDLNKADGVSGLVFSGVGGLDNPTFYFQVLFGAVSASQVILQISTLDPATPDGTGKATLEDKGGTIKWSITGTTKDGVIIAATIECGPVDRS